MARSGKLVYFSIKNQRVYHTCLNCHVGRYIGPESRRIIPEQEATVKKLNKCRRCLTIEAAGDPCEEVTG
jgi:hypothetical protein